MSHPKSRSIVKSIFAFLRNFLLFFGLVAFVTTCTMLLTFNLITLTEEQIRAFAPSAFYNTLILAALFTLVDLLRRKWTVDRPAKEIQNGLNALMKGDYSTRIKLSHRFDRETRFGEIAEDINLLAEELSGVETLRTDFIANVSHEMKTPLAVMQNYGTLLQTLDLPDQRRIEYAKAVTDGSRRLADLMTNILKLNRLENQQIYPETTEYDLGEQLCECLLGYENVWEKAEIEIETDIAENVTVKADGELLSLVWNNLFSNAFKFTDRGGKVSVSLESNEKYATVKVSDTGCGMSPEVGAHIFEKFYQGDSSRATQGNGLGLALVKRVVDITQGEIHVESARGVGSTFTVKIRRH